MMQIENENLFKHSLSTGINLFLGAGFSVLASSNGVNLPVGDGLKNELITHFKRKKSNLNLAQLCQILTSTQKNELLSFFKARFKVDSYPDEYKNIDRINIKSIFTTNIDNLIFDIFSESKKYYINDILLRGPAINGSSAIDFIALHGCILHGNNEFSFTPIEIATSFESDKAKWSGYISRIKNTPTLYWGYRLEDASVLQALSKESVQSKNRAESWIVLRTVDEDAIEYYKSLGFQIIISDTLDLLKYIGQQPIKKVIGEDRTFLNKSFPDYKIPRLSTIPVRSLSEFYYGAEPIWYDVFSGKVHETEYFVKAKDIIASRKNIVIIGAAITGKSTLLKQLATKIQGFGTNIYINEITPEKATLLLRDIEREGQNFLIFIDNAADASEAVKILSQSNNIRIVAAERDYIFDSVAHRFPKNLFSIITMSGLIERDVQEIENSIPHDINRKPYKKSMDLLSGDVDPTFFEVITSTIIDNSLTDRFITALNNYKINNKNAYELLLVACYLHTCRIPISIDIANAYLRNRGLNVLEVATLLKSMSSLLSLYEGSYAESDQLHYVPRSRYVSEVVMFKTASEDIRTMLEVFHSEVSPTRISRYDVFKRTGYDAKLMTRTFFNWQEGLIFYEKAFIRDPSYSLKQQGALYLSGKKKYELAFTWIDEARAMTKRDNPAIRNSYAVILFNANYDKDSLDSVQSSLDESMSILNKCYDGDHRKVYHAKVFSEQALRYALKFSNSEESIKYLDKSNLWLTSELKNRQGDRRLVQLIKQVENKIRNKSNTTY